MIICANKKEKNTINKSKLNQTMKLNYKTIQRSIMKLKKIIKKNI